MWEVNQLHLRSDRQPDCAKSREAEVIGSEHKRAAWPVKNQVEKVHEEGQAERVEAGRQRGQKLELVPQIDPQRTRDEF